ncbi:MAG: ketoacyl-ACP synthase III [Prevotella sp.]|nr:ketoacyl-ACP synthase III [Prevotella sp.]
MDAFIKAISYYLPEKVVTNEQLVEEFPEWSVEKIAKKVGISERHVAAEDETAGDLAVKAAEKLFAEHDLKKDDVDFVLLCTQSPDYFLPSTSCVIQSRLGLPARCGAFDFNLGCSGYEYGLAVAKGLIVGGIAKNVLLLTAETYNKHIHPKDKGNRTIFGDGASASLISTDGFAKIGEFVLGSDGSGFDRLIHKTGGMRQYQPLNDLHFDENNNPLSSDYLFMDGKAIFDFTSDVVPAMTEELLKKHGLKMEDVDLFVFHQANKYMINYLRKLMSIDKEKFYVFMENVGNTVSSTIPIALCEARKEGRLHGKVLLAGFGVGLSYGATIIECK